MTLITHSPALRVESLVRDFGSGDGTVRALDGVTLGFEPGTFTAVMGPSGSGKSTLLQSAAGLDRPTSGRVYLGDQELGGLSERALARIRRERVGLRLPVVQPARGADRGAERGAAVAARRPAAVARPDPRGARRGRPGRTAPGIARRSSRAASSSASRSRGRWSASPRSCSPTSPTGALDIRAGREVLALLRDTVDTGGRTLVMVTHDPSAAAGPTASCSWPTGGSRASCRPDRRGRRGAPDGAGGLTDAADLASRRCARAEARSRARSSPSGSPSRSPTPPAC